MALTREDAQRLDAEDPLAAFRDRFEIVDEHRLYMDGNSLGRLPKAVRGRVNAQMDDWGARMVSGWPEWIDAPTRAQRMRASRGWIAGIAWYRHAYRHSR